MFEAGKEFDLKAGCPNLIERIEGGLLSFGNDMTYENTPLECNFDKFFKLNKNKNCVGFKCLDDETKNGPTKRIKFFKLSGTQIKTFFNEENIIYDKKVIGKITSAIFSPNLNTNVAIGMIETKYLNDIKNIKVSHNSELHECEIYDNPIV